jgi:hypothetical protein
MIKRYNSISEKLHAHQIRRLTQWTRHAARLAVENDIQAGIPPRDAWAEINAYQNELLPFVQALVDQDITFDVSRKAYRAYTATLGD